MNSKEIFEEYTQASGKSRYIKDKAAELNVKESDIICELLKSGYKFEELKRANKGTYNAGMNKFKKWQENGSPEDEDADVLEQYTEPESTCPKNVPSEPAEEEKPEYEYPATDEAEAVESSDKDFIKTMAELKYKNDKLEVKVKSLAAENVELKAENSELENDIENQNKEIKYLQRKVVGTAVYDETREENERLKKEKEQFMKRIDELEAEKQVVEKQLDELSQSYNEAMLLNKKIEQDAAIDAADLVSERENLTEMHRENEGLRKRLERAERYILNSIYEQFEDRDGDNEDGMV